MAWITPAMSTKWAASTGPRLRRMPMATRSPPGMGEASYPRDWIFFTTASICAGVASLSITISISCLQRHAEKRSESGLPACQECKELAPTWNPTHIYQGSAAKSTNGRESLKLGENFQELDWLVAAGPGYCRPRGPGSNRFIGPGPRLARRPRGPAARWFAGW